VGDEVQVALQLQAGMLADGVVGREKSSELDALHRAIFPQSARSRPPRHRHSLGSPTEEVCMSQRVLRAALLCLGVAATAARAETVVEVLEADPAGSEVTLGGGQNYHLRLRYSTDAPTQIWVHPLLRGEPVAAGTSPSRVYTGTGEALAWFFLMRPGLEVDAVRIDAGDGTRAGTHPVATWPVHVVSSAEPAAERPLPAWVDALRQRDETAQRAARKAAAATPPSAGDTLIFTGFLFAMLALGVLGVVAPVWAVARFAGLWKLAAALPLAGMAFVILRIIVDTRRDPTSHNLWPFEILMAGVASIGAVFSLAIVRRATAAKR